MPSPSPDMIRLVELIEMARKAVDDITSINFEALNLSEGISKSRPTGTMLALIEPYNRMDL